MKDFTYKLTLDLNCENSQPAICSGQFDKGRKFEFTITADGEPYDVTGCSATLKGIRSDGSHFAADCTVEGGKVIKILEDTTLSVNGQAVAKLVISDSEKSYSTQMFIIDVDNSLDGDITTADNYSVLNRLIEKIHALNESGAILVDDAIDSNSNNAVANSAVAKALSKKLDDVPGCIKRENLEIGVVGFEEIEDESIVAGHISNGAVTADKIADSAVTKEKLSDEVKNTINNKADKANTLSGYEISDAYTKREVDNALSGKLDNVEGIVTDNKIATGAVTTDKIASKAVTSDKIALGAITSTKIAVAAVSSSNIAENQVYTRNLANSAVTTEKLADDVKTLINSKYSGSNVETGTGNLTVYTQGAIDSELIKSCSFCYQKTGKLVNIFFNIVFNAGSIGYIQFTGLPFKGNTITNQIRTQTVTTMNNQVTFYPVNNWLTLNFNGTKTFAQDETLKGVITMQIN